MLTRLLFAVTLAASLLAMPAVADTPHGGSGIVGPTWVGDLKLGVQPKRMCVRSQGIRTRLTPL